MMLVMKKRTASLIVLGVLVAATMTGAACRLCVGEKTFLPGEGRVLVIDAGHGAPDGGAVGIDGVLEKDLNLSVALMLQQFFEQNGTHVILTRSDDNGIYDVSDSVKSKKNSDMKNREEIIKSSGADAFISIHMNQFSDGKYSGPQVFYSKNHANSKLLAESIQQCLTAELNPAMKREVKQSGSSIYLLKKAEIPAVLVECGFLSNLQEQRDLMKESYRKRVAWAIYCGVIQYLDK